MLKHKAFILMTASSGAVSVDTSFLLTCTTTGAQTLTLHGLTVGSGTVTVNWGDGNTNIYSAGAGARTHNYAGAGTWTVRITDQDNITLLNLQDTKLSATINADNPMPANLTSLTLYGLSNFSWTVSADAPMPAGLTFLWLYYVTNFSWTVSTTNPMPSGLTALNLNGMSNFTWTVNATTPMPAGLTTLTLYTDVNWTVGASAPMPTGLTQINLGYTSAINWTVGASAPMPEDLTSIAFYSLPNLTWTVNASAPMPAGNVVFTVLNCASVSVDAVQWKTNSLGVIRVENNLSAATVDAMLQAIWENKANYTYATPSLDLLGGGNYAPNGTYQSTNPPTTGKEYAYDLVNGTVTSAGPEWTVEIYMKTFSLLGDSIAAAVPGWTTAVMNTYGDTKNKLINHAVGGHSIMANMDAQTTAAVNDNADIVIICLGTNDNNGGNMTDLQAEVEENIAELGVSNTNATIYYMNLLPKWTDSGGETPIDLSNIRTAIAAACTAQSITCWDTFTSPWITAGQTSDGIHPTTAGNSAISTQVLALL